MQDSDQNLLDSFERIFRVLENESRNLKDVKSIHTERIRQWENEVRSYARILEDISLPARLILEHLLKIKHKGGQVAVEADNIVQGFAGIHGVKVEEFGVIKISAGSLRLSWRDQDYNYLLYPDKVELRTVDEKTTIKLFFSHNFARQEVHNISEISTCKNVLYLHPDLQKLIRSD